MAEESTNTGISHSAGDLPACHQQRRRNIRCQRRRFHHQRDAAAFIRASFGIGHGRLRVFIVGAEKALHVFPLPAEGDDVLQPLYAVHDDGVERAGRPLYRRALHIRLPRRMPGDQHQYDYEGQDDHRQHPGKRAEENQSCYRHSDGHDELADGVGVEPLQRFHIAQMMLIMSPLRLPIRAAGANSSSLA